MADRNKSITQHIKALRDENWRVREKAAEALGKSGDARAIEPITAMLQDSVKDVRQAAAKALDRLGWHPMRDENGASYWVTKNEWAACIEIGAPAVQSLIIALGDHNWRTRRGAAVALGKIGDARAVEPLISALKNEDELRNAAIDALEQMVSPLIEPFIAAIKSSAIGKDSQKHRPAVALALGDIGDLRAVEPLKLALKDSHESVRKAAAEALDRLDKRPDQ